MAQNTIDDLSETFSSNLDFLGQSMQGGANANTIDTIFQKFAALIARFYSDLGGTGTVGGTANAITFTSASTYTSLTTGLIVAFKAASSISGAATFKLDALAAKDIKLANDTDVATGDIVQKQVYLVRYDTALDGGNGGWALLNPTQNIPVTYLNTQTFTSNGTYTPTAGTRWIKAIVKGGGGGGRSVGSTGFGAAHAGAGGGEGATAIYEGPVPVPTAVTIGAGGAANSDGAQSSLGALATAPGGSAGGAPTTTSAGIPGVSVGGPGGVVGTGTQTFPGQRGENGTATTDNNAGTSAVGGCGAGPGGGPGSATSGVSQGDGGAATGRGSGGGGAGSARGGGAGTGGAGLGGYVIVEEYA